MLLLRLLLEIAPFRVDIRADAAARRGVGQGQITISHLAGGRRAHVHRIPLRIQSIFRGPDRNPHQLRRQDREVQSERFPGETHIRLCPPRLPESAVGRSVAAPTVEARELLDDQCVDQAGPPDEFRLRFDPEVKAFQRLPFLRCNRSKLASSGS